MLFLQNRLNEKSERVQPLSEPPQSKSHEGQCASIVLISQCLLYNYVRKIYSDIYYIL